MREGGKRLRRLGLAALFMLAASAADAQTHEFATGHVVSPAEARHHWTMAGRPRHRRASASIARACAASRRAAATNANMHAVLIVRHGNSCRAIFPGHDEPWGTARDARVRRDDQARHASVSKSVISLLMGLRSIANLIRSVDEPVSNSFRTTRR